MNYFALAFIAVLAYRILFCLSGYIRAAYYERKYKKYISGKGEEFAIYTAPIRKLLKQAGIPDSTVTAVDSLGHGQFQAVQVSVVENLTVKRGDVIADALNMLSKIKGTFLMNLRECFSPLYWVQLVLFFPIKLCEYLGISGDKLVPKLIQILYWISAPLLLLFRTQLYEFIVQLFQQAQ